MSADCLIDTNVLFYAALGRREEPEKHRVAREVLAREDFAVSTQILQEFYVNITKKTAIPLAPADALEWIEVLLERPCAVIDPATIKIAIEHSVRYRISYWDAALIAAAESLGIRRLLTEDLNHGQVYGSVTAHNPFRHN
jgi:predicted nucleic acid-binding protein